jgi:hypothetical protein
MIGDRVPVCGMLVSMLMRGGCGCATGDTGLNKAEAWNPMAESAIRLGIPSSAGWN